MNTTIYDIAKKAKVSAMTVSRVLNRKDATISISKGTKEKVIKIAKELDYTPDFAARALRKGQSSLVGVIIPNVTFSYLPQVIEGIEAILRKKQSSILLCTTEMDIDKEIDYLKMLYAKKVDGLIMWPSGTKAQLEKHIHPFLKRRKPVVFIYRDLFLTGTNKISVDAYTGAYEATRYLIQKGHRRIASRENLPTIRDITPMTSGYKKALEDNGIEFDPELQKPMGTYQETYQSVNELLSMPHPPTAIYTTGDYQAFGAINAIRDAGLKIPEDVAVLGNNDVEFAAMSNPPLTTVAVPKQKVGELAGKMILDALEGQDIHNHELKPKLIIRKST